MLPIALSTTNHSGALAQTVAVRPAPGSDVSRPGSTRPRARRRSRRRIGGPRFDAAARGDRGGGGVQAIPTKPRATRRPSRPRRPRRTTWSVPRRRGTRTSAAARRGPVLDDAWKAPAHGSVLAHQPLTAVGVVHQHQHARGGAVDVVDPARERRSAVRRGGVAVSRDREGRTWAGRRRRSWGTRCTWQSHTETRKSGSSAEAPANQNLALSASTTSLGVIEVSDWCEGDSLAVGLGFDVGVGPGVTTGSGEASSRSTPRPTHRTRPPR